MSSDFARTAFIADGREELSAIALLELDSVTAIESQGTGLTLRIQYGRDTETVDYDGVRWSDDVDTDSVAEDDDSVPRPEIWKYLLPPELRTTEPPDDETFDEHIDHAVEHHAELIELVTTVVASGWSVELRHEVPRGNQTRASITIRATAPSLNDERATAVFETWGFPAGIPLFETVWSSPAPDTEPWGFNADHTFIATAHGPNQAIDPNIFALIALSAAPAWTVQPGVDRPFKRHSTGGAMEPPVLVAPPADPPAAPSGSEIARRRTAVAVWAKDNGFVRLVEPALPKATQQALEELGDGDAGYYLLEFDNGDCYLGQSISIAERLKGHRSIRKDIVAIRLHPDPAASALPNPLRHLLDRESVLIASVQQANLHARNKAQMTYQTGHRAIDDIFAAHECTSREWLADPFGINTTAMGKPRNVTLKPAKAAGGHEALQMWTTRAGPHISAVLSALRLYMQRCLPLPAQTEYEYWTLSSPMTIPPWRTLSNLTIGWTEAMRINIAEDGHLSGWVQVNGIELLGEDTADEAVVRFLRQHPGTQLDQSPYQASGPYNLNIRAANMHVLNELLDDTTVTRAAATAALHLMRHSKAGANRSAHNPVLVNTVLAQH